MCFAGLWDCVQYEGSDEKHYTYSIITTDSNKQLSFLHDRMPVVLENGSDQIRTWLDPGRSEWSKELQSMLKPYDGELECYPVSKDVGKVGNNSPSFIVPVASAENKNNIANFFGNAKSKAKGSQQKKEIKKEEHEMDRKGTAIKHEDDEDRKTVEQDGAEDNAPMPVPEPISNKQGVKREYEADAGGEPESKAMKRDETQSPTKHFAEQTSSRKTRSATNNSPAKGNPIKSAGSQKITNFYK